MHYVQVLIASLAMVAAGSTTGRPSCSQFPSSMLLFSADFKQPEPPLVKSEYRTNFVQHKWNQNLSHITTGFINNSPSARFVRVDEAYDGNLASSFFNYANVSEQGLVDNTLTTYNSNSTTPDVWRGYVNSNFPIFQQDILVKAGAVFGGLVHRQFVEGLVAAWNIMYQGVIPVTIFVDNHNVVIGYDYFSPDLRTRVVTEYFNIQITSASA
ncbi:hypothetical protein BR93DRAFT_918372 [Coniochaeta sp. PMI_546]|nr:hypothetical protein BR93DRAFT_918372 [Coniochaeta sp. PMI_546]